ncbi:MAG: HAD-IIB family hydrolase [Myxococcota bacterium]
MTQTHDITGILATDLDGTLLPLADRPEHLADLDALRKALVGSTVIFATGRHRASIEAAMSTYVLPSPSWVVADVGTSVYRLHQDEWSLAPGYVETMAKRVEGTMPKHVFDVLSGLSMLRRQPEAQQGQFKMSFFGPADDREALHAEMEKLLSSKNLPYRVVSSVDPFNGEGLFDVLPRGASKALALNWLCDHLNVGREKVVYAGDSGNDLAAFEAGFMSIVVGNATDEVYGQALAAAVADGQPNRVYRAKAFATSGVLEGCRHFGLIS